MSRSYKHSPVVIVGCSKNKKVANKKVRRYKGELGSFCFYKRIYDSWEIKDYVWYSDEEKNKNKNFRKIARIIRKIYQGKLSPHNFNLEEFLEKLEDYRDSFKYVTK